MAQRDVYRILDANLNRVRETLRVIEDHARFVLDDAAAALRVKECRHSLREIVAALDADELLAARDIVGDVGRETKTPGELTRAATEDVARAAFGRLAEATRVLGEYAKLVSPPAAAAAERLRYRGYALEQHVVLRSDRCRRLRAAGVYVLLTEALCAGPWLATAEAAIRGGAGCIQLREKSLADGDLLRRAHALRELTAAHGVLLAINDRPDIARLVGADIVHVGQEDLAVCDVRHVAGGAALVGRSTHTVAQLTAALDEEPDYVAVGPMYQSITKPQDQIAGPATLAAARERTPLPLVAIGGITAQNARAVWAAGADCLAVCGEVIGSADPAAAVRALLAEVSS